MGFVHDDQFGTILEKGMPIVVGFNEVDADHLEGIMAVNGFRAGFFPLQTVDCSGADDDRLEVELLGEFDVPLIAKVGRAENGKAFDFAPVDKLAGNEQRFDGFPDADVVGDEKAERVEAEGHEKGDKLIDARTDGDPAEGTERGGALAQGQAGGLPEEMSAGRVGDVICRGQGEPGGGDSFIRQRVSDGFRKGFMDKDKIVGCAGQRTKADVFRVVRGHHHPFALAVPDD